VPGLILCCAFGTLSNWNSQHENFKKTKMIERKLNPTAASAGTRLGNEQRKELVELFYDVDKDRNGWLSENEAFSCLPPALCPDGEANDSIEWDPVDDDRITLVEW
jgi:hypothetical protein